MQGGARYTRRLGAGDRSDDGVGVGVTRKVVRLEDFFELFVDVVFGEAEIFKLIAVATCVGFVVGDGGVQFLFEYFGLTEDYIYEDRKSTRLNSSHVAISY